MDKCSFVLSAILLLFALAVSEIEAIPKLCEKSSRTYSGKCDNKKCDTKCIQWEKAAHGACHKREGKNLCFCYFDCTKTPSPGKGDPPAKGGSPPSKKGGSSPPKKGDPPPKKGDSSPPAAGGSPPPPEAGSPPPPPEAGGSPPPPEAGGSPPPADGSAPPPPAEGGTPPPPADAGTPPRLQMRVHHHLLLPPPLPLAEDSQG